MQKVVTAQVGTLDLQADPYCVLDFDLPNAELRDSGRAAQLAGAPAIAAHYHPAPYSVTVGIKEPTVALREALLAAFAPGSPLTWGESSGTGTSTIRSVEYGPQEDHGNLAILEIHGTRSPAWRGATTEFTDATLTQGIGTIDLPVVGGDIAARVSLSIRNAAATSLIACGIQPDPQTGYDPIDDYDGTATGAANAYGGQWANAVTLSGTAAALATAPAVPVAANRGEHAIVAHVKHTATSSASVRYQAQSVVGTSTASEYAVPATATDEHAYLGNVVIPAAQLPDTLGVATGYGAATTDHNQAAYDTATSTANACVFDVDGDMLYSVAFRVDSGAGAVKLFRTTNDGANVGEVLASWQYALSAGVKTNVVNAPTAPGEKLCLAWGSPSAAISLSAKTGNPDSESQIAATFIPDVVGATITPTGSTTDIYLVTKVKSLVTFDASNPIVATCSESSKLGSIDVATRIPTKGGGAIVKSTRSAGQGVTYDPDLRAWFPCDATGVIGSSLAATTTPLGEPVVVPNVVNRLVVHTGAKDTATVEGLITEQRITRG